MINNNHEILGTMEAGKTAARYNMLMLLVFPVLAVLKLTGFMSFEWMIFGAAFGMALLAVIGSISVVSSKPIGMVLFSTIISASTILLVHRDGLLILIFPILIAMLYNDVRSIRMSFIFSGVSYILVEILSYYLIKAYPDPGILAAGVLTILQLFVLLSLGLTLVNRMKRKLETENLFMENIAELLSNATSLAEDIEVDETQETKKQENIVEKVKQETIKILKYNKAISEMDQGEEKDDTVMEDLTLLLALSDKLHKTLEDLGNDLGQLSGAVEGIGEIIQDAKDMAATAAVEEVAMKEKEPEISAMAAEIGALAHGAKDAAERLVDALKEIGSDGEKAVETVDRTYESVYRNLELINRNVEMLLRWFVLKRGAL